MNTRGNLDAAELGLLFLGFNQESNSLSLGTETGFCVFKSDPLEENYSKEFGSGISCVEPLGGTKYVGLVGGGKIPKFLTSKLVVWDDLKKKCVIELEFRAEIIGVRLRRDRIVTIFKNRIVVHTLAPKPVKLSTFETEDNENAICALCQNSQNSLLAFPGRKVGQVQIVDIGEAKKTSTIIQAHETEIRMVAMNNEGTKIATASKKGTLIRVFDIGDGKLKQELRRGSDPTDIFSIAFNSDSTRLCVASAKGSIHIFNLDLENRSSSFAIFGEMIPYFASKWSFASFHIPETRCIANFGTGIDKNSVIVACANGVFYKLSYDLLRGGRCKTETCGKFLSLSTETK